jgi:hypothetical protein
MNAAQALKTTGLALPSSHCLRTRALSSARQSPGAWALEARKKEVFAQFCSILMRDSAQNRGAASFEALLRTVPAHPHTHQEGVTFNGTIVAPGKVLINGSVSGELQADDLQIGKNGKVTGKVQAREIDVHGELNEDINCKEHILIHSTGKVTGSLEYSELEIQRGGRFHGDMKQK